MTKGQMLDTIMESKLTLPAIFQSGAIMQRDCPLPVWGWGPPSHRVRVTLAGGVANGWISARGEFRVVLPPLGAGGPHTLRVAIPDEPEFSVIEQTDIWIGEVWLASGQSNMQWTLEQSGELPLQAMAAGEDPLLRMFTVERRAELAPQREVNGEWQRATPEQASGFSAVGYHFARRLREELGVAVGVIVAAWGGTPIEAWLSRRVHAGSSLLRADLLRYEQAAHADARWQGAAADLPVVLPADPGISKTATEWPEPGAADADWQVMRLPTAWQRCGHNFSGIFWFRKRVTLPDGWVGKELKLDLGAIDKQDITFVNGVEVGRTGEGFDTSKWNQPRSYAVPATCVTGNEVLIAVRVYSFEYEGGMIGPRRFMRLSCPQAGADCLPLDGEWLYRIEHDFGRIVRGANPGHGVCTSPYILYDNMIAPLIPFALRGMLWYQGENNLMQAAEYPVHLEALIEDWRAACQQGDLPFIIVQLPGCGFSAEYADGSSWAKMRQGQLDVARKLNGAGIAVTLDCGEADNIHPVNKGPVGYRLAQWALAESYGRTTLRGGPLARQAVCDERGGVFVDFDDTGSGLSTCDDLPVAGIFLIDAHGVEYEAEVQFRGAGLLAEATSCPKPVAIAYACADFPLKANLRNREGFPASPFYLSVLPVSR